MQDDSGGAIIVVGGLTPVEKQSLLYAIGADPIAAAEKGLPTSGPNENLANERTPCNPHGDLCTEVRSLVHRPSGVLAG
jgi:hypothetical protein